MLKQLPQAILFDLDGTLVDSVPDLVAAVNVMLGQLSLPTVEESQLRNWIGNGAEMLVRRALAFRLGGDVNQLEAVSVERALAFFVEAYHDNNGQFTQLYSGVERTLKLLSQQKIPLAVVTNKPIEFVPGLLSQLGVEKYFSTLVGGDCAAKRKPEADPLLLACKRLSVEAGRCLMVGDSKNDIKAARNANMPVVAVAYGYNHGEDIALSQPDAVFAQFDGLLAYCGLENQTA